MTVWLLMKSWHGSSIHLSIWATEELAKAAHARQDEWGRNNSWVQSEVVRDK